MRVLASSRGDAEVGLGDVEAAVAATSLHAGAIQQSGDMVGCRCARDQNRDRCPRERIGAEFRPEKVILFGSHAYGSPSEDSDVDLLVIMEHSSTGIAQALEIVRQVRSRIPVDLVVRTPQEMRRRLQWNDFFLKGVVERGEVLNESAHP